MLFAIGRRSRVNPLGQSALYGNSPTPPISRSLPRPADRAHAPAVRERGRRRRRHPGRLAGRSRLRLRARPDRSCPTRTRTASTIPSTTVSIGREPGSARHEPRRLRQPLRRAISTTTAAVSGIDFALFKQRTSGGRSGSRATTPIGISTEAAPWAAPTSRCSAPCIGSARARRGSLAPGRLLVPERPAREPAATKACSDAQRADPPAGGRLARRVHRCGRGGRRAEEQALRHRGRSRALRRGPSGVRGEGGRDRREGPRAQRQHRRSAGPKLDPARAGGRVPGGARGQRAEPHRDQEPARRRPRHERHAGGLRARREAAAERPLARDLVRGERQAEDRQGRPRMAHRDDADPPHRGGDPRALREEFTGAVGSRARRGSPRYPVRSRPRPENA